MRTDTNQTRTVKKVVPTDSFFTFFKPPTAPAEDDADSNIDEDIDEKLELDYQIGEDIKDRVRTPDRIRRALFADSIALQPKIVPHAIDYFTGKALAEDLEEDDFSDEDFDEEDFDEDDLDDDDDDVVPAGRAIKGTTGRKAPQPPASGVTPGSAQDPAECKNQ